jgi:F0F1-type ATP synthase membrane subunit b/b'
MNALNFWAWEAHRIPLGWFFVNFTLFAGFVWSRLRPVCIELLKQRRQRIMRSVLQAQEVLSQAQQEWATAATRLEKLNEDINDWRQARITEGQTKVAAIQADMEAQIAAMRHESHLRIQQAEEDAWGQLLEMILAETALEVQQNLQQQWQTTDHSTCIDAAIVDLQKIWKTSHSLTAP